MIPLPASLGRSRSGLLALLILALSACDSGPSGSGGGSNTTTTGDGKYHPPSNGTHISEKEACEALVDKQGDLLLDLHCVGTGQTCPSFLRAQFQTACMEYDQGSVAGCLSYYAEQTSCDALKAAIEACVITPYPGTEPNGCPMMDAGTGGMGGTGGQSTTSTGGMGGTGGMAGAGGTAGTAGTGGMAGAGGAAGGGGTAGSGG